MHIKHKIKIRVKIHELPAGEQVYIVGNHEKFGNWQPDAVPLVPGSDGDSYWQREFELRSNSEVEFKFTRGSWKSEAVDKNGNVLPNTHLLVENDALITREIDTWKDLFRERAVETFQSRITGTVELHRNIAGRGLLPRDIIVWLPESYATAADKRYPVLYMHDGQNIFDPLTSYTGIDWQADETATRLINEKRIREMIIVGIYNTNDRLEEYSLSPTGKKYRQFVCGSLKKFIDEKYRTLPDREDTATMGSSMGGLVSFLLAWYHPETFGKASCLSPSFIFRKNQAVQNIKRSKAPGLPLSIYMDCGGVGGERLLHRGCKRILRALRAKGIYTGDQIFFSYHARARHSESDWAKRLEQHFTFLFPEK